MTGDVQVPDGDRDVEAAARAIAIVRWDEYRSDSATADFDALGDYDREQWLATSRPLARAALASQPAPTVTDEAVAYRVGRSYGIHVYSGDRPVATFHDADEAAFAVEAMNGAGGTRGHKDAADRSTGRTGADEGLLSGTRDGMTG